MKYILNVEPPPGIEEKAAKFVCRKLRYKKIEKRLLLGSRRLHNSVDVIFLVKPTGIFGLYLWRENKNSFSFRRSSLSWILQQREQFCIEDDTHQWSVVGKVLYGNTILIESEQTVNSKKEEVLVFSCYLQISNFEMMNIEPDVRWSYLMIPYLIRRIHLDYIMACLSTLGGAHSSLGEASQLHAHRAGTISVKQFAVALKLGDPLLASHCKIFFAQSLMQRGHYKKAAKIIRREYEFSLSPIGQSERKLSECCKAAWIRLKYLKQCRKVDRRNPDVRLGSVQADP